MCIRDRLKHAHDYLLYPENIGENLSLDETCPVSYTHLLNYQLDVFRKTLEECKNKKGQKIVFIHGKGDGVLRKAILRCV